MNKTAFVTGASGFTGGHLARRLVRDGWKVRVLVRNNGDHKALKDIGCELIYGDLCKKASFADALEGVDVVFHIAACYREEATRDVFWNVNVEGTRNMLEASEVKRVGRFIHCSTVGVHGEIDNPPADEEAPFKPGDAYQESKLEGEKLAYQFLKEKRLKGAIFRPVGIYGPGDRRFLKLFKMAKSKITIMIGKGDKLYHLTFIDDLVDGILLLAKRDDVNSQIFILGGETYTTLVELLNIIGSVLGKKVKMMKIPVAPVYGAAYISEKICSLFHVKPILYRRRLDFFIKDRAFNIDKAKSIIGYRPKVSLEEGLKKTAEWYKKEGWL